MNENSSYKMSYFLYAVGFIFLILIARLYYLQIMRGEYFLLRSENNFIQKRVLKHSRGKILDSNGRILVDNRLSYDLYVTFSMLPDSRRALRAIGSVLKIDKDTIKTLDKEILLRAQADNKNYSLVPVANNIDKKTCQKLLQKARSQIISGVAINYFKKNEKTVCDISINALKFPSQQLAYKRLARLLTTSKDRFFEMWEKTRLKARGLARFRPLLLALDIGYDSYAKIENAISMGKLAGISVMASKKRRYVYNDFASHAIGFVNQVSIDDIKNKQGDYDSGDYIGRRGVEALFEDKLRGKDGTDWVVVDAKGRRFSQASEEKLLGRHRHIDPKSGHNIRLSIDYDIQRATQDLFKYRSGSVIVMNVNTGFIKAMASFPAFDPNIMVKVNNADELAFLNRNKDRPFRNKAVQDHYAPGSTFKPITAIAGLSKNIIDNDTIYDCTGRFRIHKTIWRCFRRWGHGKLSISEALKVSCDSFFYELGSRLGLNVLSEYSRLLGFGKKTQIGFRDESAGLVPSTEYYRKRFGYVAPGFVVNMAIGQGDLSVTPLQLLVSYSAIANEGKILKPQLVKEVVNEDGETIAEYGPKVIDYFKDSSFFKDIIEALSHVVDRGGSAYGIRYKPEHRDIALWLKKNNIQIVGKTGTAQVVKLSKSVQHLDPEDVSYQHRDHAWFVALYPKENPQIAVVVMTEHGGYGASSSAPLALRIIKKWHEKNMNNVKLIGKLDD